MNSFLALTGIGRVDWLSALILWEFLNKKSVSCSHGPDMKVRLILFIVKYENQYKSAVGYIESGYLYPDDC